MKHGKAFCRAAVAALLLLLLLLAAGCAAAEAVDRAELDKLFDEFQAAAQDEANWKTGEPGGSEVVRPEGHDIAELGEMGFIALWNDVTLVRETGGPEGIRQIEGGIWELNSYQTGTVSTGMAAGQRVFILEQTGDGNLNVGLGTVSSLNGNRMTLNAADEKKTYHYIRCFNVSIPGGQANGTWHKDVAGSYPTLNGITVSMADGSYFELSGSASGDYSIWRGWVKLDCNLSVRLHFLPEINFSGYTSGIEIPLIPIEIPIPPVFTIDLSPKIAVEGGAEGAVGFRADWTYGFKAGVYFKIGDGITTYCNEINKGPDVGDFDTRIVGTLFAGGAWGINGDILGGILSLGVNYEEGFYAEAKMSSGDIPKDELYHCHGCGDYECIQGFVCWQKGPISIGASCFWGLISHTLLDLMDPIRSDPLFEFYNTSTYKDEKGKNDHDTTACPHYAYRLKVHVQDSDGNPLAGALVSVSPREDNFAKRADNVKTDRDGNCDVYVQKANPTKESKAGSSMDAKITASYTVPGEPGQPPLTASATITEHGADRNHKVDPEDLTLEINTRKVTLSFTDKGTIKPTGMPDPISTYPGFKVHIPDDIPSKPFGFIFSGWSTLEDGGGDLLNPGQAVSMNEDAVLYAQWHLVQNTWAVTFNANGGDSAPDILVGKVNEPIVLTDEPATWEHHRFLGWSTDQEADMPEYPVGAVNSVPYNEETPNVVLYAVWGFDPVETPIKITYDVNGGPEDQKPADMWVRAGSYANVSSRWLVWDEYHLFLGWSTVKDADEPMMEPGDPWYFPKPVTLYAVWKKAEMCELSFEDPGPQPYSAVPETMIFFPSISSRVNVPDTVPEKEGYYFTGWNTQKDGSGTYIAPGAGISLTKSTVLYAQWRKIEYYWIVIYNANGGSRAPEAQIGKMGEAITLTADPAVWEGHNFLGWSRNDDSAEAEFPAGQTNTLPYDPDHPVVILNAVWGFDPVDMPVCISFNMNGGPEGQRPSAQWIKRGSLLQLSGKIPVWNDDNVFMGWSTNPRAASGEYKPGKSYIFRKDTTLYAIWARSCYITFDLAGGTMDGKTGLIKKKYGRGEIITIPGPPVRKGYEFLYWEGSRYNPGDQYKVTGDHTLTAVWKKKVPATGDSANPVLWLAMALLGAGTVVFIRKKERHRQK